MTSIITLKESMLIIIIHEEDTCTPLLGLYYETIYKNTTTNHNTYYMDMFCQQSIVVHVRTKYTLALGCIAVSHDD